MDSLLPNIFQLCNCSDMEHITGNRNDSNVEVVKKEIKILLLGPAGSGKSTLMKQIRLIHGVTFVWQKLSNQLILSISLEWIWWFYKSHLQSGHLWKYHLGNVVNFEQNEEFYMRIYSRITNGGCWWISNFGIITKGENFILKDNDWTVGRTVGRKVSVYVIILVRPGKGYDRPVYLVDQWSIAHLEGICM